MAISNPTIQAQLDQVQARQAARQTLNALADDSRDYLEALQTAGREFNAHGLCLRNGKLFYEGSEVKAGGQLVNLADVKQALKATRSREDLEALNAALSAALT